MVVLRHLGALAAGVLVALAAIVVHRSLFPLGLLLSAGASVALAVGLVRSPWPRSSASYALGWLVLFGVALAGRPEGDFVLAQDVAGYALMLIGLVVLAVGVVALGAARGRAT